jgi:hypothetical protein
MRKYEITQTYAHMIIIYCGDRNPRNEDKIVEEGGGHG